MYVCVYMFCVSAYMHICVYSGACMCISAWMCVCLKTLKILYLKSEHIPSGSPRCSVTTNRKATVPGPFSYYLTR